MARDYPKSEVLDIIDNVAAQRGINRDDFLRFAYIETGGTFDETASRGPKGAKGLFQFVHVPMASRAVNWIPVPILMRPRSCIWTTARYC